MTSIEIKSVGSGLGFELISLGKSHVAYTKPLCTVLTTWSIADEDKVNGLLTLIRYGSQIHERFLLSVWNMKFCTLQALRGRYGLPSSQLFRIRHAALDKAEDPALDGLPIATTESSTLAAVDWPMS